MNDLSAVLIVEAAPQPRARTRRDDLANELADSIMMAWADWCRFKLTAQGYGGGVDREGKRMPRAPGTHGDPVLAEVIATAHDGQQREQIVHDIIRRYPREWQKVARARWVGVQEVSTWAEGKQTDRIEVGFGAHYAITVRGNVPKAWRWSGLQPFIAVEAQTGIPLRTCERITAQIKRLIVLDVAAAERPIRYHVALTA